MQRNGLHLIFVLLALVGLTTAPALGTSLTAQDEESRTGSSLSTAQQGCNYEQLYSETISSVALIQTQGGLGSGFLYNVSENRTGYVITNNHVVNDTARVQVTFTGSEAVPGTVIGTDAVADLAVVRVNETPETAEQIQLADSPPRPGERVAALGSPFGLRSTITSGIISGVNRSVPTQRAFDVPNTIQTDAPINPGNSGGPLVSCNSGAVVGVNTLGGGENIGFAVPASIVERVVPQLIAEGDYEHSYMGVQVAEVSPLIAQANDLNATEGVIVLNTQGGTPASAELQESNRFEATEGMRVPVGGDVIVSIDGQPVDTPADMARYLAVEGSPGDPVRLTVLRNGQREQVTVTLTNRPAPGDV
ncbi:S1C family serine protease [Haloarcula laminariae]|uniref:S1C family serine protease n=1 Tax=Haloarcula laminariae TaxID=2961577 RepID=UPI0021C800A6|nr:MULTISPECIES: trypsin-like peptidase domain-containing protein [Halomicroarcula]